jgi:hypothetical protein
MTPTEFRHSIEDILRDIADIPAYKIAPDGSIIDIPIKPFVVGYDKAVEIATTMFKMHLDYLLSQMKQEGLDITGFSIAIATRSEDGQAVDVTHYSSSSPFVFKAIVDAINRRYYTTT